MRRARATPPEELPLSRTILFRHPSHARELHDRAVEVGLAVEATWGEGKRPTTGQVDFVLAALGR